MLLRSWDVNQILTCAYRPQGNARVERMHRTIKRSVARTGRDIEEAVFWYNVTKNSRGECPFEMVFGTLPKRPGISGVRREVVSDEKGFAECKSRNYEDVDRNPFVVGDLVYVRNPGGRCDGV